MLNQWQRISRLTSKNDLEVSSTILDNQEMQATRKDEQIVVIPRINSHIDFVFGNQQWKLGDCDLMVQIPHMKCLRVRSHI